MTFAYVGAANGKKYLFSFKKVFSYRISILRLFHFVFYALFDPFK